MTGNYSLIRTGRNELFVSASLDYHTGRRYEDFDIVAIPLKDEVVYVEASKDEYKNLPDYFNLDLKIEWVRQLRRTALHIFFEVLNATDHKNVMGYYVPRYANDRRERTEPGILPFAGIKISF